ncbi:MAG TPA: ABC transporter permease [Pseudonocardiaceae bacterium]|jgi:ribose/xylose/arabinose/galactoside ABC-type transport system permease subunit|nr:ABC transporter permease [Pseudonocardiaceae bacterium]
MTSEVVAASGVDRARLLAWLRDYGVYAAIVLLVVVATSLHPAFLSVGNLRVQAFQLVPTLFVSLGMALVIATEGVDLSVGAVIALAASLIPLYLGYNAWIAIALCVVGGAIAGTVSGLMVAVAKVQPIVATLALMIGLRGVAVIFNGNQAKPVNDPVLGAIGLNSVGGVPIVVIAAVVVVLIVLFVVRRTTFGRQLVAVGDNRAASALAGLPVRRVLLTVYIVSGVLAALAGVLLVGHGAEADPATQGLNIELAAITAVVVGGTPLTGGRIRVLGTVAGALFMQLLSATLIQHDVPNSYAQMAEAVIICLAVYAARDRSGR